MENQDIDLPYLNNILQDKQKILKTQVSESGNILAEAVNSLSKKSQNIDKFVQIRQKVMQNQPKLSQNNTQLYKQLKQLFDQQKNKKMQIIKTKFQNLMRSYFLQMNTQRKQKMQHKQIQVQPQPHTIPIYQQSKLIKILNKKIQYLHNQISYEKTKNINLQKLYQQKCIEFQNQLLLYRNNKIILERSVKSLNSKKNLASQKQIRQSHTKNNKTLIIDEQEKKQQDYYNIDLKNNKSSKSIKNHKFTARKINRNKTQKRVNMREDKNQNKEQKQIEFNIDKATITQNALLIKILTLESKNIEYNHDPQFSKLSKLKIINLMSKYTQTQQQTNHQQFFKRNIPNRSSFSKRQQKKRKQANQQSLMKRQSILISFQRLQLSSRQKSHKKSDSSQFIGRSSKLSELWKHHMIQNSNNISNITDIQRKSREARASNLRIQNYRIQKQLQSTKPASIIFTPQLLQIKNLKFEKDDLISIFLNEKNAQNYEYLNISNQTIKNNPKKKQKKQLDDNQIKISTKSQLIESNQLINCIVLTIKNLKKSDYQHYQNIRNFLRYPYSSIFKNNDNKWNQYAKQEKQIDQQEIKRYIQRIIGIHKNCQKRQQYCYHIKEFYHKIGIRSFENSF